MARKPILTAPVLSRENVQSRLAADDMMSRVIENDAAKHGRAPSPTPQPEHGPTLDEGGDQNPVGANNPAGDDVNDALSKQVSTPLLTPALTQISDREEQPEPVTAAPAYPTVTRAARERLLARESKERNIRLSIDVPESVYDRIKKYVHEQKVESTRALTLALYEDFLEEEGY